MKLPKKMKEQWVTALRSGKYQQGQGRLQTVNGSYCCLGVLQMEVSGEVERYPQSGMAKPMLSLDWCTANGIRLDMPDDRQYIMADDQIACLAEFNDGPNYDEDAEDFHQDEEDIAARKSFLEIADYIEQNVETID